MMQCYSREMLIDCLGTENTNAKKTRTRRRKKRRKEHSPLKLNQYMFYQGFFGTCRFLRFVKCGLKTDKQTKRLLL